MQTQCQVKFDSFSAVFGELYCCLSLVVRSNKILLEEVETLQEATEVLACKTKDGTNERNHHQQQD